MIAPEVNPPPGRTSRRASKKRASDPIGAPPGALASEPNSGSSATVIDASRRQDMIREAAYFRAQQRGFAAGEELQDWLVAEQQIDQWLNGGAATPGGYHR